MLTARVSLRNSGERVKEASKTCKERFPKKVTTYMSYVRVEPSKTDRFSHAQLIDFYEAHLKWRSIDS